MPPLLYTLREGHPINASGSLRCKRGNFLPVTVQIVPLRDEQNVMRGAVEIFIEAAAHGSQVFESRQSKLAKIGCLDPLTGVLNHAMVQARLQENLNLTHVYPIPFCVVSIALDNFSKLRDRYGQAALDAALAGP